MHRVADALEDFLGSPLLANKIEQSYDVIAQLLGELCDGGMIATTEPNALHELVEAPSWMKSLLGALPSAPGSLAPSSSSPFTLPRPSSGLSSGGSQNNITVPWRRSNVRHTSNEIYVDLVETLHITLAPSGRPLAAFAHGTIAFNCKVSGVPDMMLVLTAPGGPHALASTLQLPVFHPCVRLNRWKERPGELSFVPPDGRFLLGGYEVDLLAPDYIQRAIANPKTPSGLQIPASVDVRTILGPSGAEFEARLLLDPKFASKASTAGRDAFTKPTGLGAKAGGTSAHPTVEEILVRIPVPAGVRSLSEMRPSRGEAQYIAADRTVEWRIGAKDASALSGALHSSAASVVATLRCAVVGSVEESDEDAGTALQAKTHTWDYDDNDDPYQTRRTIQEVEDDSKDETQNAKKIAANKVLMPTSASVSFQVKGWLASGIKVEKLAIDAAKSKGLGAGVQPYKGVKYLTVSENGVESRC